MKTYYIVDSQTACTLDEVKAETPEAALRAFAECLDEPLGQNVVAEEKLAGACTRCGNDAWTGPKLSCFEGCSLCLPCMNASLAWMSRAS